MKKELKKLESEVKELAVELAKKRIGLTCAKTLFLLDEQQMKKLEEEINAYELTLIVKKMSLSILSIFIDFYAEIEKKGNKK